MKKELRYESDRPLCRLELGDEAENGELQVGFRNMEMHMHSMMI